MMTAGNAEVTEQTRWLAPHSAGGRQGLAGLGIRGREELGESPTPARFFHGDLTGSVMLETGPTGAVESSGGWGDSLLWQYTAFGEPLGLMTTGQRSVHEGRYKYDGQFGYESGFINFWGANENLPPIFLLHVGERWYEPDIGRFVQRDPVGLDGGLNVYAYAANCPSTLVDPRGENAILIFIVRGLAWLGARLLPAVAPYAPRVGGWLLRVCSRISNGPAQLPKFPPLPPPPVVQPGQPIPLPPPGPIIFH